MNVSPPSYDEAVDVTSSDGAQEGSRSPIVRTPSTASTATTLQGYSSPVTSETKETASMKNAEKKGSISSSLASTEALRRLRDAEDEVKRLRELNQRLKAEGAAASGLSINRIKQLQLDARASSADTPGRANSGLFKSVCATDLLFLIDTTASMSGHIQAAKEQVKSIVNDIKFAFLGEAEVRISVVGYKDHQDTPNIQFLDFTMAVNQVRTFIDDLRATGGGDTPEDMLGGINQALNATWKNQTRCIIHIADAPPHGRDSHDLRDASDQYATPGSEPHALTYAPLMKKMVGMNVNYALLRINNSTDRMALNFMKIYLDKGSECQLHKSNKYYTEACNLVSSATSSYRTGSSFRSSMAKLQFEETELGTSYEQLRHLVVQNVTSSASRTAVRMSASTSSTPRKSKFESKLMSSGMDAIKEDEDDATPEVKIENVVPQWDKSGWLNETIMVEGFSPDVGIHGASTLNDMMEDDENIKMSITELTINKRPKPFAQGAMRVAAYARTKDSTNRFVVKSFKKHGRKLAHLAEDMRCQALCKAFAFEFNALLGEDSSLDFIVTTCLRGKRSSGSREEHLSLEPFIEGVYVKYNNNTNWVNKDFPDDPVNQAAQAFSHFTFERSQGQFLVSDLQGVGRLLTDPAIHTRDDDRFKLSDTNLGEEGFKFFFSSHECNDICRKLQLKSNRAMFVSSTFEYRNDWPSMDNVVCCSNKLCGKILQLASSKTSDDFPGHHWCDYCFPQLQKTTIQLLCVAPGPHHEFRASRFFYESQGRHPPRLCTEHRGEDTALFKPEFNASTAVISNQYRSMPAKPAEPISETEAAVVTPALETSAAVEVERTKTLDALTFRARTTSPPLIEAATATEVAALTCPASPSSPESPIAPYAARHELGTMTYDWIDPMRIPYEGNAESAEPTGLPYTPYAAASVARTHKRSDNPAAVSRLSLSSGGGFWSKLKKRSLSFKPSHARLVKKD